MFAGIDIGTSGGRCVVVDERGRLVAAASRPWRYRAEGPGIAELDLAEASGAIAAAVRAAVGAAGGAVAAVGITSQRTGVVLLAGDGTPLYAGPNADGRGVMEGIALERDHGEAVYRQSGRLPVMLYLPARLAWFRTHRPDAYERVRHALSFSDWLAWRLTGVAATEPTQAAEMLVWDLGAGTWSADLCARLGVPPGLLPDVLPAGTPSGAVTAAAAETFGLPAGTPVVPAGADTQCAALGMGVVAPGDAAVVAGSTMIAEQVTEAPVLDDRRRLWTSPGAAGGWVLEAHCGESGAPIDWLCSIMGVEHEWLDLAAASAAPGAGGLLFLDTAPSRAGDFPLVRTGALAFPAPLLALGRGREDVARAMLESIAFAARMGLEWIAEVAGAPAASVSLAGGVARMRTAARVLATALGRPVRAGGGASESARGAAILAAAGCGAFGDPVAAARAMAERGETIEPVAQWQDATAGAEAAWRERITTLEEAATRVSALMGAVP